MAPTGKIGDVGEESGAHIPSQVLEQAREAERLHQEFLASLGPTGKETPKEIPGKTGGTGGIEKPVEKIEEPVKKIEEPVKPSDRETELIKEKEAAEQRYRVLQGKYNAEVPDFALKLTQAINELAQLRAELSALKSTDVKKVTVDLEKDPSIQYIKTEFPDVWKAVNLVVENKIAETKALNDAEIKKVRAEVDTSVAKTTENNRERFFTGISDKVEGWQVINDTPEWKGWLREIDPYSGVPRQALLNDAYEKMDVTRTVRFLTDYIKEAGLVKAKPVVKEEKPAALVVKKIENIAPDTVDTKKPDAESLIKNKPEIVKSSEVTQYYRELEIYTRTGQKVPDDLKVRGLQIDKAIMEGRVE